MTWTTRSRKSPAVKLLLTWRDVRNLLEPNLSLAGLGKRYGLSANEGKGAFPHSSNKCLGTLKNSTSLPPEDSPEWYNDLTGVNTPLSEIRQALEEFERLRLTSRYHYLILYLKKDVSVLAYGFWNLWSEWKERGINVVITRTFTVSKVSIPYPMRALYN